ncbi:MAG: hypothetical protein ACRENE_14715 [Polyangiaceae bacterium]
MRVSYHLPALLVAALSASAVPRVAQADPGSDAENAKELFEHGRDLRAHGNCADALPLFQKAYSLFPSGLGSLRNVAVCDETLGRSTSARAAWLELRRALVGNGDPKYAGWSEDADHAAARLAPRVAALAVDVVVAGAPGDAGRPAGPGDGIDVTVDGNALAREQLGATMERDPGKVVVRAVGAAGVTPEETTLTLAAGETRHVTLRVIVATAPPEPVAASPAPGPSPTEEPSPRPAGRASPLRTGAWVAFGVGAAGVLGTAISFSMRQSALGALSNQCPMYATLPCDPAVKAAVTSDESQGRTASALIDVFGTLALAGAATGVVLYVLGARGSTPKTALVFTPTGAGAAGVF